MDTVYFTQKKSTLMPIKESHLKLVKHRTVLPEKKALLYRVLRNPLLNPYNRLALLITGINFLIFKMISQFTFELTTLLVVLNFTLAICIRQQYVINALFAIATSAPKSWPLSIRWALGKVYHFGGIHVGAFFSGLLWFSYSFYLGLREGLANDMLYILIPFHCAVLVTMTVFALPKIRAKYHNTFELIGRFGLWSSLILFWVQFFLTQNEGFLFYQQASFWALSLSTFSLILPWLRLKKIDVDLTTPSSHVALAKFNYGVTPFAGSSTDLSRNPLIEWHSFANVPSPGKDGFRLTISRAGDWTGKLIDEKPEKLWVKGVPTAGVGNIEKLFKKVIWVATGSGIGPCLPHLLSKEVPSRLVWSTRNPTKTYGEDLVNEILAVQKEAIIWDTDEKGKPDLVQLAYEAYKEFDAEAVICISNKKVTWHVNYELESRGIPAFGAIWDS